MLPDTSYELADYYRKAGLYHIALLLEYTGDAQEKPIIFRVSYVDHTCPMVRPEKIGILRVRDVYEYFSSIFDLDLTEEQHVVIVRALQMLDLCCKDYLNALKPSLLH